MSRSDRVVIAAGVGALVLAVAAATVLLLPAQANPTGESAPTPALAAGLPLASATTTPSPTPALIVVDVAGAVARPGMLELTAGSRVGDAISAAGGYASDADLDAATAALNLAQPLSDGEQVRVPRLGDAVAGPAATPAAGGAAPAGSSGSSGGALVNLNTATPEVLEALPGIGPVTVQKIVAARQERPFSSLDDAVQRGVIHRGQLEDIRGLATAS